MDFRGFDSSIILILRGGIPRPIGDFPESLSRAMLVGVMLVGRWGVLQICVSTLNQNKPRLNLSLQHVADLSKGTEIAGPQGQRSLGRRDRHRRAVGTDIAGTNSSCRQGDRQCCAAYIYIYIYIYICRYVYMYICIYVYVYMYIG